MHVRSARMPEFPFIIIIIIIIIIMNSPLLSASTNGVITFSHSRCYDKGGSRRGVFWRKPTE